MIAIFLMKDPQYNVRQGNAWAIAIGFSKKILLLFSLRAVSPDFGIFWDILARYKFYVLSFHLMTRSKIGF